jgi:hypothetical protein
VCLTARLDLVDGRNPQSPAVSEASDVEPPSLLAVTRSIVGGRKGLHVGDDVTFTYVVAAAPELPAPLTKLRLIDPGCEPQSTGGDANRNRALDPGEAWSYKCILTGIEGRLAPVRVVGRTADDETFQAFDMNVPPVIAPKLLISSARGDAGLDVTLRNTGDDTLTKVGLACDEARAPEAAPESLGIGATASFTCPATTKTITALAVDSLGAAVRTSRRIGG